jgi:hypothetical protein
VGRVDAGEEVQGRRRTGEGKGASEGGKKEKEWESGARGVEVWGP